MNPKTTLTVFAIVAAFVVAGLLTSGLTGVADAAKYGKNGNGGGDLVIRDFLNENNPEQECEDSNCAQISGGSGDDFADAEFDFDFET
jgi:hypothetical protein